MMPSLEQPQYWAFISYSSKDKKWGQWLHKRLEAYPIPPDLQGQTLFDGAILGSNLRPIFRDRDELAGSSDLGTAIHQALERSRFLVVLCSRASARSGWVNKEISDFKALGKGNRILALILDGEPNSTSKGNPEDECFPPELRYPSDPIAGDLRKDGDGPERGFLKVLSGIAQLDFDKLYRRHERARTKRMLFRNIAAGALISVFAGLAGLAWWQSGIAENQRREAVVQRLAADQQSKEADLQRSQAINAKTLALESERIAIENQAIAEASTAETAATLAEVYNRWGQEAEKAGNYADAGIWYLRSLEQADTLVSRLGAMEVLRKHPIERNILAGHTDSVRAVVFAPDGEQALSCSDDGTVRLWNMKTEMLLRTLYGHTDDVQVVAYSPDGKQALSGSDDKTMKLWDLSNGKEIRTFRGHTDKITSVAFSADGKNALTGSWDGTAKLWDLTTGREIQTFSDIPGAVYSAAFSPDGNQILTCTASKIQFWNLATAEKSRSITGTFSHPAVFSPDRKMILSDSSGNVLTVVELATGKVLQRLTGHTEYVTCIAFSPDGAHAISGSDDTTIKVWDLTKGQLLRTMTRGSDYHTTVAFPFDGKMVLAGLSDNTVQIWDPGLEDELRKLQGYSVVMEILQSAVFSTDGRKVLSASKDGKFGLRDLSTGKMLFEMEESFERGKTIALSTDGKQVLIANDDNTIGYWNLTTGKELLVLDGHSDDVSCLAFLPDGQRALSASGGSWDQNLFL